MDKVTIHFATTKETVLMEGPVEEYTQLVDQVWDKLNDRDYDTPAEAYIYVNDVSVYGAVSDHCPKTYNSIRSFQPLHTLRSRHTDRKLSNH